MNQVSFDALTRRASLVSVGMAGIAALASPLAVAAKKKKNKRKGDVNKLCKQEVSNCLSVLTAACEDATCVAAVELCCPKLTTCNFGGFLECILASGQ